MTKDTVVNVRKILAVINATYAVAKRNAEKIRLAGIRTLTSAIPVQRPNQLSYQANWELPTTVSVKRKLKSHQVTTTHLHSLMWARGILLN